MPIKRMDIKEFREKGYLQEVNRRFFHPLGLALEVVVEEDGSEHLGGIWDYRSDPEGMIYGEDIISSPEFVDKANYIERQLARKREIRIKQLGFFIQPVGGQKMDKDERRAKFVYEAARLHAIYLNCPVIPKPWDEREPEFKSQFVELIHDLCTGKRKFQDPEEAHNSWMKKYFEMGWKYGETYDPENKIHPDLVPYDQLDLRERVKDDVFLKLVSIAKFYIW